MPEEETHYKLLKILGETPGVSQRELAARLGVSLGKTNYCLRALVEKGWVKMGNFRRNPSKMAYAYLLTPRGIEEKAHITARFLAQKMQEFEALKQEIERLRFEAQALGSNEKPAAMSGPN